MMRLLPLFITLIFLHPTASHAVLGEAIEPSNTPRRMPSAFSARAEIRQAYTVQTTQSDTTTVREFVAPSGIVFAVVWNGLSHPDLSILLGSYHGDFQNALKDTQRTYGRRSRAIRANRVVVEQWGHMRSLSGRAYDPSLIPGGVSLEEIQ